MDQQRASGRFEVYPHGAALTGSVLHVESTVVLTVGVVGQTLMIMEKPDHARLRLWQSHLAQLADRLGGIAEELEEKQPCDCGCGREQREPHLLNLSPSALDRLALDLNVPGVSN